MNWNNLPPDSRLSVWRKFREEIKDTDLNDKLDKVAKYWADAPLGTRTLDYYSPDTWLSPWEILYHGSFCQNSISLLIYYTLLLSSNGEYTVDVFLVDDGDDRYLLPVVNQKYILNYQLREVVELTQLEVKILDRFEKQVKQYA